MKAIAFFALIALASASQAAELFIQLESDVYQADGMTIEQILRRGEECMKSSAGRWASKVEPARDGDTVYATLYTMYSDSSAPVDGANRAVVKVLAKDGRFKVKHEGIERYMGMINAWSPLKKDSSLAKKDAQILRGEADGIAVCIRRIPEPDSNW